MKAIISFISALGTIVVLGSSFIRYDALYVDARPVVATGIELRGEADGGCVSAWDTSTTADGWVSVPSGDTTARVLVLNTPAVVGGRLTEDETWASDRIRVVRDDVIVPSGVTLALETDCVVKFLPESRLVVESGGNLVVKGALLADFADDAVGGDTNMNGDETEPSGVEWWRENSPVADLAVVRFLDGAHEIVPKRSYSLGVALDELPQPKMEGARFMGWFTAPEGAGAELTAQTKVTAETTAYAHWQPLSIAIDPVSLTVDPEAGSGAFAVAANCEWTAVADVDWIRLATASGSDNGTVSFAVAANESTVFRSGTVRVTMVDGAFRDFTVTQRATQSVAKPTIKPGDGTTFSGARQRVSITCLTDGAVIRYTLDGTDPDEKSLAYSGSSFNVTDTVTVKARAFAEGMKPSEVVSARFERLPSLQEAIDQPLWTVTTGGDAAWDVDTKAASDGRSCARSGAIGDKEESWLETKVEGAGTLSFRWKVICEDDPDGESWDYLSFSVDGMPIEAIDGDSGWRMVSVKVKGESVHSFKWTFCKDEYTDEPYDDIAWVDQVSWTPTVTAGDLEIPVAWLESVGSHRAVGSSVSAANDDPDGDGFTTAEEYVMGTDPNDPDSKLTAEIEIVDGKPVVRYAPDLKGKRNYVTWGKRRLDDPKESWEPVMQGREGEYNFFKISVEMPK